MEHDLRNAGRPGVEDLLLSSRQAALDALLTGLDGGPLLITGGPGVGKTWLASRLAERSAASWAWVAIDLHPLAGPETLLRSIVQGLGLGTRTEARSALARALAERHADGLRCGLIVDEAHLASVRVLEELRILSNRSVRSDRFTGLVLVGQTSLAHRLSARSLAALDARLAARVHLRPLDLDEARELLMRVEPALASDRRRLDRLHRDLGGSPRRLLQAAIPARAGVPLITPGSRELVAPKPPTRSMDVPTRPDAPTPDPGDTLHVAEGDPWAGIAVSRPPLRVEENLIEVGWEPDAESEKIEAAASPQSEEAEPIHDHYAALQAWNEWSANQGRLADSGPPALAAVASSDPSADPSAAAGPARRTPVPTEQANVWVESPHPFAPYSQLFSRVRQANDSDP
jgi:general secretion pathway protein A